MKKPWFKNWKVWASVFGILLIIGILTPEDDEKLAEEAAQEEQARADAEKKKAEKKKKADVEIEKLKEELAAQEAEEKEKAAAEELAKEASEEAFAEALQGIIDVSDGVILDIYAVDDDYGVVYVEVSDAWYLSPDYEKERFADTVGASIKEALNDKPTFVNFYDAYGKELASEKMFGGYKIKR